MKIKKIISLLFIFSLCFGTVTNSNIIISQAKKKVKLSKKKTTIDVNEVKTLTLKNAKKKVKWTTSNKKVVSIESKYGKYKRKVDISGCKKGKATITAKCARKRYKCKITVKAEKYTNDRPNNRPNNNFGTLTMNVSNSTVVIGSSGSATVNVGQSGYTGRYYFYYDIADTSIVTCKWGPFVNQSCPLYITGKYAGSTTITITNSINNQKKVINVIYKPIDITLPSMPITLNNYSSSNVLEQTYILSNVTYEIRGDDVYLYFSGKKTYDYRGSNQSSRLNISWKLYKKGSTTVIDSGTCYSSSIAMGESFENDKDYIWNLENGEYELKILNTN